MKRANLYSAILKRVLNNYSGFGVGSVDYLDVNDYIGIENFSDACDYMLIHSASLPKYLRPLLCSIRDNSSAALLAQEVVCPYSNIALFEKLSNRRKYHRDFMYASANLVVAESSYIFINQEEAFNDEVWKMLESVMVKVQDRNAVVTSLANGKLDRYILACNKTALGYPNASKFQKFKEELYAYALAASLHDKTKLSIPKGLEYNVNNLHLSSFNYLKDNRYQQYYDVLDALNDWLYSEDILTAFMRMYQILEYLVYRKLMHGIVNSTSIKQSFLRGVKTINDTKFGSGERTTMVDEIAKMFPGIWPSNSSILKAEQFIFDYFGKTKSGGKYLHTRLGLNDRDKAISRFIYDMRCSIVHNKEAEFHIAYTNYTEYKKVIPLAIEVHDQMMNKIWQLLNQIGNGIEYDKKEIELY